MNKLQTRLALSFLLITLVSMAVIGVAGFTMGREQIVEHTFDRLAVANRLTEADYARWLKNSERSLEAIAQRPLVIGLSERLSRMEGADREVDRGDLLDNHLRPLLFEREFETLFLMSPDSAEILASSDQELEGKLREDQSYFHTGLEETNVQTIYYDLGADEPKMTVATPVLRQDGTVVGVLAGHLNLDELVNILAVDVRSLSSEENYLVNGRGLAVSELLYRPNSVLQLWVETEGVERCLAGESNQGVYQDYRGITVFGVYSWIPEHRLCLVTEVDRSEAIQPVQQYQQSSLIFGSGIALLVSLIGYLATGRLAAPVQAMRQVASQFREGDLDARMDIPKTEEYADLAREFNRMAAELQKDLQELEERYHSLFQSVPVGLYRSTIDGQFLEANDALLRILGFEDRKELLESEALNLYAHHEDRESWLAELRETGSIDDLEVEIVRADGDHAWLRHNAHLIEEEGGRLLIEGAVFDITAEHEIAQELRRSEARFRSVVQQSRDLIAILDEEGKYRYVSPAVDRLLGYSAEELLGANGFDLIHPDDLDAVREQFASLLKEPGNPAHAQMRFQHADGSWRVLDSIGVNHLDDPDLGGLVIQSRDVTDRVRAEQQLEEYAQELTRSNQELEEFAYVASHDLQEPLRMVSSYVQLLARRYGDQLDEGAEDFIHYAVDGAHRMQQLINDLLIYSRVQTKGKELVRTDSGRTVELALQNLEKRIEESEATVEVVGDLPHVRGDDSQLVQLFQNLIANAIKFRSEEVPCVRISAVPNGKWWTFAVEDNGIGIDEKFADRIFLIFQRLHTRQEYGGTGIGLSVARKIVERHGGEIWFESEIGKGTTFYFTLEGVREEGGSRNGRETH